MSNNILHLQNVLKSKSTHDERLNVLFCWVKSNVITFKQFKHLLNYLEQVEEIKDLEFITKLGRENSA